MTVTFERKHPFDPRDLETAAGFARIEQWAHEHANGIGHWYVTAHTHTCPVCGETRTHTGLEATRAGDLESHRCCGRDIRHG